MNVGVEIFVIMDSPLFQIYRGSESRFEMDCGEVEEGVEYTARVCAIRLCEDSAQLPGPYSSMVNFNIPIFSQNDSNSTKNLSANSKSASAPGNMGSNLVKVRSFRSLFIVQVVLLLKEGFLFYRS